MTEPMTDERLDTTKYPNLIEAGEEFARQLKLHNIPGYVSVAGVGWVGQAEKRGFNDALEQVAKWLDTIDCELGLAAHVRSMKKP